MKDRKAAVNAFDAREAEMASIGIFVLQQDIASQKGPAVINLD